uniref:Uncharacterized protein LOC105127011 n=1 Tax=Rhizophora mucronata TaxID=61149 RepID=A0A2P2LAL9_RHIMU
MGSIRCEEESWVSRRNLIQEKEADQTHYLTGMEDAAFCQETEDIWQKVGQRNTSTTTNTTLKNSSKINRTSSLADSKKKKKNQVLLEGYVEVTRESNGLEDDLKRTKSLTDEDLDELKGCVDLGFGFSYDEIPELCNTLPALELCYSMSQKFLDEHHHKSPERTSPAAAPEASSGPVANWKISSPGGWQYITF